MTYDMYRYIFIGAGALCVIMLIVTLLLFILLKIPRVISDLSGATARRAIKNIREQNEATGEKSYRASAYNEARGKLTDKISPSGRLVHQHKEQMKHSAETVKIQTQELANETAELANETTVLEANETTVLSNETTVLANETTVLSQDSAFRIEYEITYVFTNDIVEAEVAV